MYPSPFLLRLLDVFVELFQTTLMVLFLGCTGAICLAMLMIQQQIIHVRIYLWFFLAFSWFDFFPRIPFSVRVQWIRCNRAVCFDIFRILCIDASFRGLWISSKNHQCIPGNQCHNLSNRLASTAHRYTADVSDHCTIYAAIAWFQFFWQHFM